MLAQALIYRRESLGLNINDIVNITNMADANYRILENPATRKMSQEDFEILDKVLLLGENFKREYVTPYESFSRVFKERRELLGLSLTQLSNLTGVCRQYIWKLESGKVKKLSYEVFKKMKSVLDITDEENFEPFFNRIDKVSIKFINDGYFGTLIRDKRIKLDLSQEELAISANIHDSLISKIEIGARTSITSKTAIKLMDKLAFTDEEKKRYLVR